MKKELIKELKEKREKSHITPCTFQNSGITLVALIITIIVLLILAVVAIREVTGNGIIAKAKEAKTKMEQAQEKEQAMLEELLSTIDDNVLKPGTYDEEGNLLQTWEELDINVEIDNPNSNYASKLDENATMLVIKNGITKIGAFTFQDCKTLKAVRIPDSVKEIGYNAFSYCSSLTNVKLPKEMSNQFNMPFNYCNNIETLVLPKGLTSVLLADMGGLSKIELPDSVTSVTIIRCTSLSAIELPNSVTKVFFDGCTSLSAIELPNSVTKVSFNGCTSLSAIELPDGVETIENEDFSGCTKLNSIKFSKNLKEIAGQAFKNCSSLTSISIPGSVVSLHYMAFMDCSNLKSIILEDGFNDLNHNGTPVLYNGSVETIVIPLSVTTIGTNAIRCSSLKTIYYKGTEEQWNAITKSDGWNNACPEDVNIVYNYQG